MSSWPPTFDDIRCGAHSRRIERELAASTPVAALPKEDRTTLFHIVLTLDSFAATAMSRLAASGFTADQLNWPGPPPGSRSQTLKNFERARGDKRCVDAAYGARNAIFSADWILALYYALDAGHFSMTNLATIGRKVRETLPRRGSKRPISLQLTERRAKIIQEAEPLLSRHSLNRTAQLIARKHGYQRGYSEASVSKILRREFGKRASRSQKKEQVQLPSQNSANR